MPPQPAAHLRETSEQPASPLRVASCPGDAPHGFSPYLEPAFRVFPLPHESRSVSLPPMVEGPLREDRSGGWQ